MTRSTGRVCTPGGQHMISGSNDNKKWDTKTGSAVDSPLEGHTNAVMSIAYSPDGRHMSPAEHRWLIFSSQPWVLSGGLEPTDPRGRSILHEWLVRDGPQLYVCTVPVHGRPCSTKHNRQDRALTHVRKHLNARPYECNGRCGNPMW